MTYPSHTLPHGYQLNGYRIDAVLGEGGFGITYRAIHTQLRHWVAIKEYFPSDYAVRLSNRHIAPRSPQHQQTCQWGLERFLTEAQTLAHFNHPNIVKVKDFFRANDTAYIVMEYAEGWTFGKWLIHNPNPTQEQLLQIFLPVLDGLSLVHQHHYLHRDIKPDNIYICKDGRPLLLDFGTARQAIGEHTLNLTAILSEGYAPFEQYTSKGNQGAWTDIYAVACCLYYAIRYLFVQAAPCKASDRSFARNQNEPDPLIPAVQTGRGRYDETFLAAIDRGMAFLPKDRPQTVTEWRNALLASTPAYQAKTGIFPGNPPPNIQTLPAASPQKAADPVRKVAPTPPKAAQNPLKSAAQPAYNTPPQTQATEAFPESIQAPANQTDDDLQQKKLIVAACLGAAFLLWVFGYGFIMEWLLKLAGVAAAFLLPMLWADPSNASQQKNWQVSVALMLGLLLLEGWLGWGLIWKVYALVLLGGLAARYLKLDTLYAPEQK
ncbi:MAG: protein kinase [Gammaproteobacteria bacterium]|nr:protein kinase [Gammaproteobacteria bacterium]MBU1723636.1 protein kinase [Gammaproteobacteria bacterium]MBU2005632.1 protein kinase [Gammaproteobacteria bacterium]